MQKVWIFDLEGDNLLYDATIVWCGVFKNIHTGEKKKFRPNKIQQMLSFMDTCDVLIAHNGIGYDFPVLTLLYGYEFKGKKVDTLLMSRLQDPHRYVPFNCPNKKVGPHSVEAWGYRLGRGKPEHNDWSQFSEEMLHRCDEDVEIQEMIYNYLLEEGKGFSWRAAHMSTFKLFEILQMQEQYGWLVDRAYMDKSLRMLEHWIDRIDRILVPTLPLVLQVDEIKKKGEYNYIKKPFKKDGTYSKSCLAWLSNNGLHTDSCIIGGRFTRISFRLVNLSSNLETKHYLLAEGWVPDKWNTNEAGERTSPKLSHDDPFLGITSGVGRLIARRVQCRHRHSQITGWLDKIREDGRLSQVISGIADTRRLKHKVLVNVPGGNAFFGNWMRKIFIAKEGYKIVGTDADSCQLRMLAARMGDEAYQNAIINGSKKDGTDIHTVNRIAAGLYTRAQAKTFIYAFLFGGGDYKIGTIVGGGKREGTRLKLEFLRKIPALKTLIDELTAEWRKNAKRRRGKWGLEWYDGWMVGLDGSKIKIMYEHTVLVYMLQSDEAIMMQNALLFFHKEITRRGYTHGVEYGYVAQMHDEFSIEVREDLAEEFAEVSAKSIKTAAEYLNIACPHEGEAKIGDNWYDVH